MAGHVKTEGPAFRAWLLSPTSTSGALMGGTIGAYAGGPFGALAGVVIGGATGAAYGFVVDHLGGRAHGLSATNPAAPSKTNGSAHT